MTDIVERRAREFCEGAFGPFGVDVAPYSKIIAELIREVAKEQQNAEIERLRFELKAKNYEIEIADASIERLRGWQRKYELSQTEIERLRDEKSELLKQRNNEEMQLMINYWGKRAEKAEAEIERLRAVLKEEQPT